MISFKELVLISGILLCLQCAVPAEQEINAKDRVIELQNLAERNHNESHYQINSRFKRVKGKGKGPKKEEPVLLRVMTFNVRNYRSPTKPFAPTTSKEKGRAERGMAIAKVSHYHAKVILITHAWFRLIL